MAHAPVDDEDDEKDDMDDDEFESHKNDLSALAEKDPEFFKYLQSNDPELLDFSMAERDDLAGIDDLSEDEAEGGKKKKNMHHSDVGNEVSMEDVKKWKEALIEKKSLRSLRQVVLAFRAAAHGNDVEEDNSQGGFKYTITNPNGKTNLKLWVACGSHLAGGGLLDGEVVVENSGDVLEGHKQKLVID